MPSQWGWDHTLAKAVWMCILPDFSNQTSHQHLKGLGLSFFSSSFRCRHLEKLFFCWLLLTLFFLIGLLRMSSWAVSFQDPGFGPRVSRNCLVSQSGGSASFPFYCKRCWKQERQITHQGFWLKEHAESTPLSPLPPQLPNNHSRYKAGKGNWSTRPAEPASATKEGTWRQHRMGGNPVERRVLG